MTKTYDIGIGWANPVDRAFVKKLTRELAKNNLTYKEITYVNLKRDFLLVEDGKLHFRFFLDRSSDDFAAYLLLAEMLKARGTHVVNDPRATVFHASKADLHRLCEKEAIDLPLTFIVRPHESDRKELAKKVERLCAPFVLKPSYGGGGENVKVNGRGVDDILEYLETNCTDECIIQKYITPQVIGGRSAWFRPVFICGRIIPLWWDPKNHFYHEFGATVYEREIAKKLTHYAEKIAVLTGLLFFSIETVIDESGRHMVVDYANHPIDVNSQKVIPDGLPPGVLDKIVAELVREIGKSH